MIEHRYFKATSIPEITVALAGISKHDWVSVDSTNSGVDEAVAIMSVNRFDVLPISSATEHISSYYTTKNWGVYTKENIVLREINFADRMYYMTNIRDAIRLFANSRRNYFFLDNHDEVIGLVTIGNLNCKHVYLYLYNQVAELEQSLGSFIYRSGITDQRIIELFEQRVESKNAQDALARFREDDANGFDYKFMEYIFLTDLCFIIKSCSLLDIIGISKSKFEDMIGKINELRKVVAHPNRSLIRNPESLEDLRDTLEHMDFLMKRLHKV